MLDNPSNYTECQKLIDLLDCLKTSLTPDLLFIFKVTPEISIKRKGKEGHLVTLSFCKDFNILLDSFKESISSPNFLIDTTTLSKEKVSDTVYSLILNKFEETRRI